LYTKYILNISLKNKKKGAEGDYFLFNYLGSQFLLKRSLVYSEIGSFISVPLNSIGQKSSENANSCSKSYVDSVRVDEAKLSTHVLFFFFFP